MIEACSVREEGPRPGRLLGLPERSAQAPLGSLPQCGPLLAAGPRGPWKGGGRIPTELDRVVQKESAGALDLLKKLSIPMTLGFLQSTTGMSANALRKQSTDEEVTPLAKPLIQSWRKLLDGPATDKDPEEKTKGTAITSQNSPGARGESSSSGNESSRKKERKAGGTYLSSPWAPSASGSAGFKGRKVLAAALGTGDDDKATGAAEEELGPQTEEAIYQEIRNTDTKYKNRARSRIPNHKDAKNPSLRKNVLCGNIPPTFARMTGEEMASDELREMRKNLTKKAIREHQMAKTGGAQTGLFTCGKCKKNCTYTQVQTLVPVI